MAAKTGGVGQRKGDMAPRCLWVTLTISDSDTSVKPFGHDRMGFYEPLLTVRATVIGTKKKGNTRTSNGMGFERIHGSENRRSWSKEG
jgi:hypothetical protein